MDDDVQGAIDGLKEDISSLKDSIGQIQDTIKGSASGGLKDEFDRLNFRCDQLWELSDKASKTLDELSSKVGQLEQAEQTSPTETRLNAIERWLSDLHGMLTSAPPLTVGDSGFRFSLNPPPSN